ncbi:MULTISPECIES: hypothetical protein [Xanthomonas]|nr:hypothetical protein [Xanthomonas oryzae]QUW76888.1 hypothetical protein KCI36_08320 [Xanthomonas oryzae]UAD91733.1 hypothetical protein H9N23_21660 [Xanthomonas oryzae pv. oryzae]UEG98952.1 hypothetical protein LLC55_10150 [Xanthomonas oryzae pv. oryzae]UEQ22100.1 hypothetical protein LNP58_12505 [Xanthomonas oryzae pv. oryzae]UHC71350.1 hypothetical protein LUZ17_19765 [Xanthomonas oryzae pv. oryzae]
MSVDSNGNFYCTTIYWTQDIATRDQVARKSIQFIGKLGAAISNHWSTTI